METGLTKNQIIAELSRSPHGDLKEYIPVGKQAAEQHSEFFAHLIAWDARQGQVRDAKVALPVVSLMVKDYPDEFVENSLAHMAKLGPREMLAAFRFIDKHRLVGRMKSVRHVFKAALLEREKNWPKWERTMLQHRATMRELFSVLAIRTRDQRTNACLYQCDKVEGKRVRLPYPEGGLFETVARLKGMSAMEAAGTILQLRIPFLVALGAMGEKANDPDLVMALISAMTPTELVTNTKMLERMGVKTNPILRAAFEKALEKASKSKANLLKTTAAAEAVDDEELKEKLQTLQDKQIQSQGVEGNWLVLADKSGSMGHAIELARHVSATLAKMVKGKVWLVFFDTHPTSIDVTGLPLDVIKKKTQHIDAGGETSVGCGLSWALASNIEVDGIAIVSDGGENQVPYFPDVYGKYSQKYKEVPVYLYQCTGDSPYLINSMQNGHHDMQVFDMRSNSTDYYSLPNLVATMRTNQYSLADEIMAVPLLTLKEEYKLTRKTTA